MLAALPRHIDEDAFIRIALTTIRRNPGLIKCTQQSLFGAIVEASQLGLKIDGILGHAYLVPFKVSYQENGQWFKRDEATLVVGYRGWIELANRSGQVQSIHADVVYQGDTFVYEMGFEPTYQHKKRKSGPPLRDCPLKGKEGTKEPDPEKITHIYLAVGMMNGGRQLLVWTKPEMDAHRNKYSQAWRNAEKWNKYDSPWHTNYAEMAAKTLVRYLAARGRLPMSTDLAVKQAVAEEKRHLEAIDVTSTDAGNVAAIGDNTLDALTDAMTGQGQTDAGSAPALMEPAQGEPEPAQDALELPTVARPETDQPGAPQLGHAYCKAINAAKTPDDIFALLEQAKKEADFSEAVYQAVDNTAQRAVDALTAQ